MRSRGEHAAVTRLMMSVRLKEHALRWEGARCNMWRVTDGRERAWVRDGDAACERDGAPDADCKEFGMDPEDTPRCCCAKDTGVGAVPGNPALPAACICVGERLIADALRLDINNWAQKTDG